MSPTTLAPPDTPTGCCFLADGRIVGELAHPTPEAVLERMKSSTSPEGEADLLRLILSSARGHLVRFC
jgi:hypothetical protein